jgi:mannose-1-phosphate guanylyltransferase
LKGTGGSLLNAFKQKAVKKAETLLVYYGDILTTIDLGALLNYHETRQAAATVALSSGFTVRVGLADLDENSKVRGFIEKPKLEKPVSIGIMALDGQVVDALEQLHSKKDEIDLMKDLVPNLIENNKPVYGYLSKAFWYDVGSIEDYEKLDHRVMGKTFSYIFK